MFVVSLPFSPDPIERRLRKQSGCEVLAALGWKPHSGQRGDRICPLKVLTGTSSDDRLCSLSPALGQILTSDLTAFFPQLVVLEVQSAGIPGQERAGLGKRAGR